MNNLVGVLFRFCVGKVAFACDIESVSLDSHVDYRSTIPRVPLVAKWRCVPQTGSVLHDCPPFRRQVVSELCEFCAAANSRRQFKRIWRLDDRDSEKEFLHGWLFESGTFGWRATRSVKQLSKLLQRGGFCLAKRLTTDDTVLESISEPRCKAIPR